MKLTRENVLPLWTLSKFLKETKQRIALGAASNIGKNFRVLSAEIENIKEVEKKKIESFPPEIKEYDEKRIELCKQFADKDENGEPILIDRGSQGKEFKLTEKRSEFDVALKEIQITYASSLEKQEELNKEFNDFLASEIELELMKIKSIDLKNVDFTVDEAEILEPILTD
jgi:hypothetical protein